MRDAFALDPYRASLGIATAAGRRGARLFEHSGVGRVRAGAKHVEITLDGGTIRAGTVIVTTGTATAEFKPLRRHFKERETYLVLTEPIPAPMRRQLGPPGVTFRDTRTPHHRVTWTKDLRLLVGGADQAILPKRVREQVLVQRTGQLMYELLTLYPAISGLRPDFGWEVPYGETADGVMYIGAHRNYPRHLFALGRGGDSMTGAFLAARILTRALAGEPDKADEAFGWTR
jgi:glycine/D-amino acid oxidase-like deaminating enzyme